MVLTVAQISAVRFRPASSRDQASGLLGYVSFTIGNLWVVDGIAVRRTRDGEMIISYPTRRDSRGREHAYLRPVNREIAKEAERIILREIDYPEAA